MLLYSHIVAYIKYNNNTLPGIFNWAGWLLHTTEPPTPLPPPPTSKPLKGFTHKFLNTGH